MEIGRAIGRGSIKGGAARYSFIVLFFIFRPRHEACGILVPRPEIEPKSPALGARSLNHWIAREVHRVKAAREVGTAKTSCE